MSSSAYPVIWAMKHAPVLDAIERAILFALADFGDADGCNCYPSLPSMARTALVDSRTAMRRRDDLEKRGLIRRQAGPPPARWLAIPEYKRPVVWEVMIPYSWWSDSQREEINRMREDRGRLPLTPEMRPDIAPAPTRTARSDKGKKNPNRKRRELRDGLPPVSETGAVDNPVPPVSKTGDPLSLRHGTPCLEDTQPSFVYPPVEPSSSYAQASQESHEHGAGIEQEEEAIPVGKASKTTATDEAFALVDTAVAKWSGHRAPTRTERLRLAERVAQVLGEGSTPRTILDGLTRDLGADQVRTTAVQVVMSRTAQPGWADAPVITPRMPTTVPKPRWCGDCVEQTRLTNADNPARCRACHPLMVIKA